MIIFVVWTYPIENHHDNGRRRSCYQVNIYTNNIWYHLKHSKQWLDMQMCWLCSVVSVWNYRIKSEMQWKWEWNESRQYCCIYSIVITSVFPSTFSCSNTDYVEIIYYCTLHFVSELKQTNKQKKKSSQLISVEFIHL